MRMLRPLMPRRSRRLVAACAVAVLAVAATPAHAQDPPGASAIDQYVEAVPSGSGPSVPGITKEKRTPLPPKVKDSLKRTTPSIASALEKVAESSTYGAPAPPPTRGTTTPRTEPTPRAEPQVPSDASVSATLRSALSAIGTTGDGRLLGLLVVVVATTLGAALLAARRGGA